MAKTAARTVRDLRLAAMEGNYGATRALLRVHGHGELASEIKRNKPWSPRVTRMVRVLSAGTNTEWEIVEPDGTISNDLQSDPPRRTFED
jgi:hypothetical protein